jgi:DNA-binding NtrC family response regulator
MANSGQKTSIYVVDDEQVIASTLVTILQIYGYNARSFSVPLLALEAAKSNPPDLLLTDVVMPGMSGIELAVQIQLICPDCKVLLFSGQASTRSLLTKAMEDGHDFAVLLKPVHPKDLLKKLRDVLEDGHAKVA